MKLLKRFISAYTGEDLLLGIFSSEEKLNKAKSDYIESCQREDTWGIQGYHEVNLEKDVNHAEIESYLDQEKSMESVFVLSNHLDGMGQVSRHFLFMSNIKMEVENRKKLFEEEDKKTREFTDGYKIVKVEVDKLYLPENEFPIYPDEPKNGSFLGKIKSFFT